MGLFDSKPSTPEKLIHENIGGILTGPAIRQAIADHSITITDFNDKNVNPNSYNLLTSDKLLVYSQLTVIDLKNPETYSKTLTIQLSDNGYALQPGNLYICSTKERVETDKYIPIITGRSSIGRLGLQVHCEAGFGDIGYHGTYTLQLKPTYPTIIYPNIPIAQVYFITPVGDIELYRGRYMGADGPVASRFSL